MNKRGHRPVSHDVGKDLVKNTLLMNVNQPTCNLNPVNKQQHHQQAKDNTATAANENNTGTTSNGSQQYSRNATDRARFGQPAPQQQQAHSMTRDLDAMGLMTQVKKGDDVRQKKHNQRQGGNTTATTQQHQSQQQQQLQQANANAASRQPPKLNLNMTNQQMYYLLKPQAEQFRGRKTLLLDIDETLVHSSFTPTDQADIVLPIDIEGRTCNIYVQVRPGCCEFILEVGKYFEVVIFTASLSKYAIPLMDILDPERIAPQRLFREHCTFFNNQFVKDMARVGRPMEDLIIIDNSPNSYQFQPENGLPILSWYDDPTDTELMKFIPGLKLIAQVEDVRPVILQSCFENEWNIDYSVKICESLLILKYQKIQEEQKREENERRERELKQAASEEKERRARELASEQNKAVASGGTERQSNHYFNSQQLPSQNDSATMLEEKAEMSERHLQEPRSLLKGTTQSSESDPKIVQKQSRTNHDQQASNQGGKSDATSTNRTDWVGQDPSQPGPKLTKKESNYGSSGKKAQPKQARSSSKPKTYEVNQGVGNTTGNNQNTQNQNQQQHSNHTQRINRYSNGKELLQNHDRQVDTPTQVSQDQIAESGVQKARRQPGPKIHKEPAPIHTIPSRQSNVNNSNISPSKKQAQTVNNHHSNHNLSSQNTQQQQSHQQPSNIKIAKKIASNSLNPEKLKQYLITSQQEDIDQARLPPKASSRNPAEGTITGSHRNLHTVGALMMKQSTMNPRTATADIDSRKNTNITFTTQSQSKTIGLKSSQAPSQDQRSSIKNGSKRRANSNHTTDKKVNLDKFLSVVQQRSNFTPSSQANGRVAQHGIAHLYKPNGASDDKKSFNSNNLTMNQSRNLERKKLGQIRLGHNATDMVFAQKKLSLKVDRENANKTSGGARGMQLNQNDIVFSKTMNLSQFLSQQTKQVGQQNSHTTTNAQHSQAQTSLTGSHTGQVSKTRASQELSQRQQVVQQQQAHHKRQKSSNNNSQNWTPQGTAQLSSLQTKNNPYMASNQNAIQQLMQGHSGSNTTKYASTKLNGSSNQSLRNQQNNSLNSKRMSAGNINVPSRSMQFSNSLNSRQPQTIGNSHTKIKAGSKKINQSSSLNPTDRDTNNKHKVQAFLDETSQQFIGNGQHQSQANSLTRSNRDYQRSPGKIFHGNLTGAQALIAASSQTAKNSNNKAINYVKSTQQNNQLQNKRQSKPQLMSELTLSLKNKKQTPAGNIKQSDPGYSNLIKPLISAGRAPQSTKHMPGLENNFSGRSYTQRIGAANATGTGSSSTFSGGPGGVRQVTHQIGQLSKDSIVKSKPNQIGGGTAKNATEGDTNQSLQTLTPRKKIIKLVSNANQAAVSTSQQNIMMTGVAQTGKNSKKPGKLDSSQTTLLNNYYQSLQRQMNEGGQLQPGLAPHQPTGEAANYATAGVQPHEMQQRKQIYSMLNDFEQTSKFNKEQMKNFGSPKGAQGGVNAANANVGHGPSSTTNASAKMDNLASIGGKKPKIRNPNKD